MLQPCRLIHFGGFGAFWKPGRKEFTVPVLRRCGCSPTTSLGGRGGSSPPHWAPTHALTATCTQALAELRLWIFAEVCFGPDTALRKDSSTLALEETPVHCNLSFAQVRQEEPGSGFITRFSSCRSCSSQELKLKLRRLDLFLSRPQPPRLITACCEVIYPFILLVFLVGINPDFD